jgi:4-amino-4-deoxy-L-arabinose transferase-like glycosyltransferase
MKIKTTRSWWTTVVTIVKANSFLIGILLLATLLRLYKIRDFITFLGDEGRDSIVVYNILHGSPTLLGPTASVGGFFMGPIYYYFMTPFLWLSNYDPVGPAIMIALLGIATVWLVYKVTAEFFNKTAGLVAAFLYAISPLVVIYSRSSWNPNPMPFFTLLLFYCLYKAVDKNNKKLFLFCGIIYGILIQLHYVELFVGAVVILFVIICRLLNLKLLQGIKTILRDGTLLCIGFLIGFSPFIAFEFRHGFLNIKGIISFITSSGDTGGSSNFGMTIIDVFSRVFGRLLLGFPPIQDIMKYNPQTILVWKTLSILLGICLIGFTVWQIYKKSLKKEKGLILLIWLILSILIFGFYKRSIYDYYYEFLYPVPFLLFGGFFAYFWSKGVVQKTVMSIVLLIMAGLLVWQLPLLQTPNKQVDQTVRIVNFVLEKADNKPFNFAIVSGNNSDHAYIYFMKIKGKEPIEIKDYDHDPQRDSVTDQLFVVCESLPCFPLKDYVWKIAFFGKATIAGHWKVAPVEVYKLTHYQGDKMIKFSPTE